MVETRDGRRVGTFVRVEPARAQRRSGWWHEGDRERLIPAVPEIVVEVSVAERRIVIDPPEGLLDAVRIDIVTLFPGCSRRRSPSRSWAGPARAASWTSASTTCGTTRPGRHRVTDEPPVRRRRRHDPQARAARRRRRARCGRRERARDPAGPGRAPLHAGGGARAGPAAAPGPALRALRGRRRAGARAARGRGAVHRRLRADGRRAGGAGGDRRGDAAPAGRARATRTRPRGIRSRGGSSSTRSTRGPRCSAAWRVPEVCARATTAGSPGGARSCRSGGRGSAGRICWRRRTSSPEEQKWMDGLHGRAGRRPISWTNHRARSVRSWKRSESSRRASSRRTGAASRPATPSR